MPYETGLIKSIRGHIYEIAYLSAGLRLATSGADLWNAFVRAHANAQLAGPPEIQMDYFTRAIETLLIEGQR